MYVYVCEQVREQLRVQSPITTEEIPDDNIHEEQTQGVPVDVAYGTVAAQGARPSHALTQQEQLEVQEARADLDALSEEHMAQDEIPYQLTAHERLVPPPQHVEQVQELVRPDDIGEETAGSIKEVRMIPGYYVPEYEPSVVERYRMEMVIRGRELGEEAIEAEVQQQASAQQLALAQQQALAQRQAQDNAYVQQQLFRTEQQRTQHEAASQHSSVEIKVAREQHTERSMEIAQQLKSHIIRAVQEVTEEAELVTETERQEIEVIKKSESSSMVKAQAVRTVEPIEVSHGH